MRILFTSTQPHQSQARGALQAATHDLCLALADMGAQGAVLCRQADERVTQELVHDESLGYLTVRATSVNTALGKVATQWGADVVVVQTGPNWILTLLASLDTGIPTAAYLHDVDADQTQGLLVPDPQVLFLANSRFAAERWTRLASVQCSVVLPVLRADGYLSQANRQMGQSVLFINPVQIKGSEIAFALAASCPDIAFTFIESETLDARWQRYVQQRAAALGNVTCLPATDDMRPVYAQAGMLLMPSIGEEAFGRIAMEAQLNGLPVLASNCGALSEVVGAGGVTLDPNAPLADWVAALREMHAQPQRWATAARSQVLAHAASTPLIVADLLQMLMQHAIRFTPAQNLSSQQAQTTSDAHLDELRLTQTYFDREFYLNANSDVAASGVDPLEHYTTIGWRQGRDPSSEFSTKFYLASNEDVRNSRISPLHHYATAGHREGRAASDLGGWQAQLLARTTSLQERTLTWKRLPPRKLLGRGELTALFTRLKAKMPTRQTVVSLGQDRYYDNAGGVQACVMEEQALFNQAGHVYIFINPYQPLPALARLDITYWLCDVSINGKLLGTISGDDAIEVLVGQLADTENLLCIHSLLGHNPAWVEKLCSSSAFVNKYFWLHDYFSLCTGYNLLRNDVTFCNAPAVQSNSCQLCIYGEERSRHLDRIHLLFQRVSFTVLAPSKTALELWRNSTLLPFNDARVLEHRVLRPNGLRPMSATRQSAADTKVRVAFLGHSAPHKGWFAFKLLTEAFARDTRFEFFHLSQKVDRSVAATHVPVVLSGKNPSTMQIAVQKWEIDIALVLSNWPETFCLAAYEARAGGASIFAYAESGNVANMVTATEDGLLFGNYAELLAAFRNGTAERYALKRRKAGIGLGKLQSSGITVGALAQIRLPSRKRIKNAN